jgi:hypothetical protein
MNTLKKQLSKHYKESSTDYDYLKTSAIVNNEEEILLNLEPHLKDRKTVPIETAVGVDCFLFTFMGNYYRVVYYYNPEPYRDCFYLTLDVMMEPK